MDVERIRQDFPVLSRRVQDNKPLVYLDNAATSQKPQQVIDKIAEYYSRYNANVHRGIHTLSEEATDAYELAREKVADFINAESERNIVFTKGTTESINLVANAWGRKFLEPGDEILISYMEHHSNIVPWHIIARDTGAEIKGIELTKAGHLDLGQFESLLSDKTKIVAVTQMSNVLGTINPIRKIADLAHEYGARVLVDGAQGAAHSPTDIQEFDCDFYAFSGHKMCGPTGVGILYGKYEALESMNPFLGGGEMIEDVYLDSSTYKEPPWKFEAGTPNIAQCIVLGYAIDYLQDIGMEKILAHESDLMNYTMRRMNYFEDVHVYGPLGKRGGIVSFTMDGTHPHDIATIIDQEGVAIRAGHHCAQPLMRKLGIGSSARISIYFYNTTDEIDIFFQSLNKVREIFGNVTERAV
ncbi:MAG: cysteine desulfurase [Candidatus Marinimicrobia bacterium]|nr:cysteine desulfurase [Candidatus Neomarinimicrobiota bacterium]MCF7828038.1 cysteine desulfurase [Candidatus Neomarinimicrobiota bacterium]MCF7879207.1 cysteine desulfurase [Candidatus Neomarinimicrobiota bacterium]